MATIMLDIPEEVFARLRRSPQDLGRDLRLAAAIYWYAKGELSQERAAGLAGLDRTDFILALSREKVEIFQTDADELSERGQLG